MQSEGQARTREVGSAQSTAIHWPRSLSKKANQPWQMRHLQFKPRAGGARQLHCLLLDCSASMLKDQNLALAKGLLMQWTRQLYKQRSELAVIVFAGRHARVLQKPQRVAAFNQCWIEPITGGGGSPVASAIDLAEQLMAQVRRQAPDKQLHLCLLTDGRYSQLPRRPLHTDHCLVVDFESATLRLGRAGLIAQAWAADYIHAETLAADAERLNGR